MSLRAFLRQDQVITDPGSWSSGKMTKTAFPLTKQRHFRFGTGWEWRVIELTIGGKQCRLLLAVHVGKQNAYAALGEIVGTDTRVVATLESHSTHPGWHLHVDCDLKNAVPGRLRGPDFRRIPGKKKKQTALHGLLTNHDVLQRAHQVFRLPHAGKLSSI